MAKIDDIYEAVDDFGLITSAEAAELGMSGAEMVQQEKLGKLVHVARGVYHMPIWPSQPQASYAIAVKAAPFGGFRLARAILSASSASSAVMRSDIDQPTMRRDHMFITRAAYSHPWLVFT